MKKTAKKAEKHKRPSWDEYFIKLVEVVGTRGTCDRGYNGAILVKDKRILATGYVGAPVGLPSCDEIGHEMCAVTDENGKVSRHCIRTAHSELNAIANAARVGVAINGATIYCKFFPCYTCAKTIINSGIIRVVSIRDYHASEQSKKIFKKAKIEVKLLGGLEKYKDQ